MASKIDINNLRELHTATTRGEWEHPGGILVFGGDGPITEGFGNIKDAEADAAWIAAAHNAMPALLDELDELRAENEAMRQAERDRCVVDSQKVIRTRLTLPFYGYQAESLGATGYRLGDDEQWEMLSSGVWGFVASHRMEWIPNRKYRLAGVAR